MILWEREASEPDKPIAFVYGADDSLTTPSQFSHFTEASGRYNQQIIPGSGYIVAASHRNEVWQPEVEELDKDT